MLDAKAQLQLQCVCKALQFIPKGKSVLIGWIKKKEIGICGVDRLEGHQLCSEVDAAWLQRSFLKVAMDRFAAVVAGSFASAAYLKAKGECHWVPGDIDIWFTNHSQMYRCECWYDTFLVKPLGLETEKIIADTADYTLRRPPMTGHRVPEEGLYQNPDNTRKRVSEWIEEDIATYKHRNDISWSCNRSAALRGKKALREVLEHLPVAYEKRPYKVISSFTLRPHVNIRTRESRTIRNLTVLRRVNFILIESADNEVALNHLPDLASYICSAFDITACAVALSVTESLDYKFRFFLDANYALDNNLLIITSHAFTAGPFAVHATMVRIRKYLERSLAWRRSRRRQQYVAM